MAWSVVRGFPDYEISTEGVVRSIDTKTIIPIYVNLLGDRKVRLTYTDGITRYRSVGRLMVATFIHEGIDYKKFKITFKDGDRSNLRLSNIQLRGKRIREVTTGLIFDNIDECAAHFCASRQTIYRLIKSSRPDKCGHMYENVEYFWPDL